MKPLASLEIIGRPRYIKPARGCLFTTIPSASRFAQASRLIKTKISLAFRFARDYRLINIYQASRFAREDRLTKIPLASRFARRARLTKILYDFRFA